jgi:hypothetical protein
MAFNSFSDARHADTGSAVETDLCIIGSGAAGITIARVHPEEVSEVHLLAAAGRSALMRASTYARIGAGRVGSDDVDEFLRRYDHFIASYNDDIVTDGGLFGEQFSLCPCPHMSIYVFC